MIFIWRAPGKNKDDTFIFAVFDRWRVGAKLDRIEKQMRNLKRSKLQEKMTELVELSHCIAQHDHYSAWRVDRRIIHYPRPYPSVADFRRKSTTPALEGGWGAQECTVEEAFTMETDFFEYKF